MKNPGGASGKRPKAALSRYRNAGSTENTSGATRRPGSLWDFAAEARQIFHGRQACGLCNGSTFFCKDFCKHCSGSPPDFSRELIPNKQCFEVCLTGNAENVINMR